MQDPVFILIMAGSALAGLIIVAWTALRGWTGWLALKQAELARVGTDDDRPASSAMARIEVADLKERIRKLEAIAAGVDI